MKNRRLIRIVVILAVAGVVYWKSGRFERGESGPNGGSLNGGSPNGSSTAVLKKNPLGEKTATLKEGIFSGSKAPEKVRGYDKFSSARLISDDDNDGDSFWVDLGGKKIQLRLYFVDAPEKYLSDRYENQQRRVAEQASELGGVSSEQIVEVGKAAKLYMERELKGKTFTVYTYWEEVYDGDRYYGFVELGDGDYFGSRLIENGLARIHTKGPGSKENPVPTPDGKSFHQHREFLYDLERAAQKADRGAWGL